MSLSSDRIYNSTTMKVCRNNYSHKFETLSLKVKTNNFTFYALLGYFKKLKNLAF